MTVSSEFNLIVSCPNNRGGIIVIKEGIVTKVDALKTTGICYGEKEFFRSVQHPDFAEIIVYSEDGQCRSLVYHCIKDIHDICFFDGFLYLVSTGTNEVVRLDSKYRIEQRFKFEGDGDAWHLNCLVIVNDSLYVSAFCNYEKHYDYKGRTHEQGFLINVFEKTVLIDKLSQPHTPVFNGALLYVCDSETKCLKVYKYEKLIKNLEFDGYVRGLHVDDKHVYLGLSKSRNIDATGDGGKIVILDKKNLIKISEIHIDADEVYTILPYAALDLSGCKGSTLYSEKTVRQKINRVQDELQAKEKELEQAQQGLQAKEHELEQAQQGLQAKESRIDHIQQGLQVKDFELEQVRNELIAMHLSTSWKMTRPLRKVKRFFRLKK